MTKQGGTSAFGPEGRTGDTRSHVSNRRPSATLAIVLLAQLQFMATLSFVDYTDHDGCFLIDLLQGLRWVMGIWTSV